jgi:hypothetical protein
LDGVKGQEILAPGSYYLSWNRHHVLLVYPICGL